MHSLKIWGALMLAVVWMGCGNVESVARCGNGVVELAEECDDGEANAVDGACTPTCERPPGQAVQAKDESSVTVMSGRVSSSSYTLDVRLGSATVPSDQ